MSHNVVKFPLRDLREPETVDEQQNPEEVINLGNVNDLNKQLVTEETQPAPNTQFNPISPDKIDSIRKESYEKGFLDGQSRANELCEKRLEEQNEVNHKIFGELSRLDIEKSKSFKNLCDLTTEILDLVFKKFTSIGDNKEIDKLKSFIDNIISTVNTDTKLKITLNSELYANNKSYIDNIIQDDQGDVSIIESSEISLNDCSVEWADGSAKLNTDQIFKDISSKLSSLNDNEISKDEE